MIAILRKNTMKLPVLAAALAASLCACHTMQGAYSITATLGDGAPANIHESAKIGDIRAARDAICDAHPGATVFIKDARTGQHLKDESPYKCTHQFCFDDSSPQCSSSGQ
jgi:hypothetical protein